MDSAGPDLFARRTFASMDGNVASRSSKAGIYCSAEYPSPCSECECIVFPQAVQ
jgi:hypothetical protein